MASKLKLFQNIANNIEKMLTNLKSDIKYETFFDLSVEASTNFVSQY